MTPPAMRRVPTDALAERARDLIALKSPTGMARRLDPHYQNRAHTELISRAFIEAANGTADRILIATPPQVGKSTTGAVWGPLWWLARNPRHRVVVGSYAADLAAKRGRAVRKTIKEFGPRFDMRMEPGSTAVDDWSLTTGGGMRCCGVDGGLTGHSADIGIVDDPHSNRKQANSLTIRDNVWDWWSSTFLTRLSPGAPAIVIMTLWHPDDLAGRVLEDEGDRADGGRWLVLKCPAIATEPNDPLGRELGEPLPHPKIPDGDRPALLAHWEDKKRTMSVRDWNALCQCDPKPEEGALLNNAILREARQLTGHPRHLITAVSVDPSGGGRSTAGVIGGFLGDDQRVYVTHDRTAVMAVDAWARAACELAAEITAGVIISEKNFGGTMSLSVIRTAWDALGREWDAEHAGGTDAAGKRNPYTSRLCPRLVGTSAKGSKSDRAEPVAQQVIEGRVRFGAYLPDVEHEWATWQPDDPNSPGRIDAMVHLAHRLLRPPKNARATRNPADVRLNRAPRDPGPLGGRLNRPGQP